MPVFAGGQIITTIAGNGTPGFTGDGGQATAAELYNPSSIALAGPGNIYIADRMNNRIRVISSAGIITTIGGSGVSGYTGDGGSATMAALYQPMSATTDQAGNTYMTFYFNNYIRKVSSTGIITTIAGSTAAGYGGDGGPAAGATFTSCWGTTTDAYGNFYIADQWNHRIRKISPAGIITTVAGSGTEGFCGDGGPATLACLYCPNSVAIDAMGNMYIADCFNNRVRKVNTAGIITTIAGTGAAGSLGDGGPATAAQLYTPGSVAVDAAGTLFIGDAANYKIRKIDNAGIITTIAGTGINSYSGDGGPATAAEIGQPFTVAVDSFENVYLADHNNNRVRKISSGICIGGTIALSNPLPGGTWSSSAPSIATVGATTGFVTGISAGVAFMTYTTGSSTYLSSVTVSQNPSAGTIICADSVCTGSSISLTDGISGGSWLSANTSGVISAANLTGVLPGTDTIYYVNINSCGVASTSKIISIVPAATAGVISGPGIVCAGSSISLTETIAGGIWSAANTLASVTGGTVTGLSAGIDTIKYTITNYCGLSMASRPVTVNPLPNAGSISGPSSVCAGATISLSETVTGGTWSAVNALASVAGGTITGILAGTDTINYLVTNSCGTAETSIPVIINPLLYAGAIAGPSVVCTGAVITLTETITGGTWSTANTLASVAGGTVTGLVAGTDTINYSVTNSCGTSVASMPVTINPFPFAGTISGLSSVCADSDITLSDGTAGGTWSAVNSLAAVIGGTVTGAASGIDTINYTVTNVCGTATAVKIITINPLPHAAIITGPVMVCAESGILLADSTTGGTWSCTNTNAVISVAGLVTGATSGTDTILYTVSNGCGIYSSKHIVTINPIPDAGIITGMDTVCTSLTILLTDTIPGGIWTSSNTAIATVSAGAVTGHGAGTDSIIYRVTNTCGTATTYKMIYVTTACSTEINYITVLAGDTYLYPNPVTDVLYISSSFKTGCIIIYNIMGEKVMAIESHHDLTEIEVSDLSPGVYFVGINNSAIGKFGKK